MEGGHSGGSVRGGLGSRAALDAALRLRLHAQWQGWQLQSAWGDKAVLHSWRQGRGRRGRLAAPMVPHAPLSLRCCRAHGLCPTRLKAPSTACPPVRSVVGGGCIALPAG